MAVKLDMFQEIVNVHWSTDEPPGPRYIILRANFAERDTLTWPNSTGAATALADIGAVYGGSFKSLGFAIYGSDFMFQNYSVVDDDGDSTGDNSGVVITGQQTIGPAPGEELHTEEVPQWSVAQATGAIGGGGDLNTGSGQPVETYSGTPLDNPVSSIFVQERLKLRAATRAFSGSPDFIDLDGVSPLAPLVTRVAKVNMIDALGEASFFDPVEGITVTYFGAPCTLIGTACQKIDLGPPVGYHAYLALFRIDN